MPVWLEQQVGVIEVRQVRRGQVWQDLVVHGKELGLYSKCGGDPLEDSGGGNDQIQCLLYKICLISVLDINGMAKVEAE